MRRHRWGLVCIGLLVHVAVAEAAPRGVRLTYAGDPATSMAVSWNSAAAGDDQVIYGTSPATLDQGVTAQQTFAIGAELGTGFSAVLTGLQPATTYYYRVGSAGNYHPAESVEPFSFTTLSDDPCAPFTFVLIGDNRADLDGMTSPVWPDILAEAMAKSPAFFVNTGDMVKNGNATVEWSGFIDDSESGWALVPSILTLGNHDNMDDNGPGALYSQLFELPSNDANGWENYYAIDIGPIHFVSLDANARGTELTQMAGWLAADLAETSKPFKMVFFHHAIYSRGNHYTGEEDSGLLNKTLIPVFDANDVDFVFNGHSHNYERYAPTIGVDPDWDSTATPRSFPVGQGSAFPPGATLPHGATATTYLVSGGAGALTTEVAGIECIDAGCTLCISPFALGDCDADVWDRDKDGMAFYEGKHNFTVFRVDGLRVEAEVWTTEAGNLGGGGDVVDSFVMTSGDQLDCGAAPPDAGPGNPGDDAGGNPGADAGGPGGGSPAGGCCDASGGAVGSLLLAALVLAVVLRRRGSIARS